MSTWVTVATLATGSLAGVVAKAGYDLIDRKRQWERDDQHRFASIKQEAYARLQMLITGSDYSRRITKAADQRTAKLMAAADELRATADGSPDSLRGIKKALEDVSRAQAEQKEALEGQNKALRDLLDCLF